MIRSALRWFSVLLFLSISFLTVLRAQPAQPPPQDASVDPKTQRIFNLKIREASTAFEKNDLALARQKVAEAEAVLADQPVALNLRGALLFKEKKYDEAMVAFQGVIVHDPNSYIGYFNAAEVLLAQKKYDDALAAFERILEARKDDEACEYRIVLVLALKGDLEEARRRAKKIPYPGQTAAYFYANAAVELVAGNQAKGQALIQQSETFFPAESSSKLRETLVEHQLIKN